MKENFPKTDVRYWQNRLFKLERSAGGKKYVDKNWSVQLGYQNRQERFQLATSNKFQAARKAREIYLALVTSGWPSVLATYKTTAKSGPLKKSPTIGEFLAELRALHASKIKTIDNYAGSLRKIAADIAGIESGGRGGNSDRIWRAKVDELKLSILTQSRIHGWREKFLARAGTDPIKARSARVSVSSFLREAKTLFGPTYLQGLDTLVLPEPLPFSGIRLERRSMPRYQSTFDIVELIKAACDELAPEAPEQFKVFVLAVCSGLRRAEIDKLEWDKFNWSTGSINVTPTRFFRTKSDDSTRTVWIPAQMLEIFRDHHTNAVGRFVIYSKVKPRMDLPYDHYRCQTIFDKLIGWLRLKGVTAYKPLHTLRKEFGSLIAGKFGIYAAKEMLGHADIATTAAHYLEAKDKPMIDLGHLLPAPANVIRIEEGRTAVISSASGA